MCERFSPWRTRVLRATAVLVLSAPLACSGGESPPLATVDASDRAVDDVQATDAPDAPAVEVGSVDVQTPDDQPGDPLVPATPLVVATTLAAGALAVEGDAVFAIDGASIIDVSGSTPAVVLTLDAPGLAVASRDGVLYAVDSAGTWYRSEAGTVTKVAGPVVQRLRVSESALVGVLGPAGIAVAGLDLAQAPVTNAAAATVRDVAFGDGFMVAARRDDGVSLLDETGSVLTTFKTQQPVTAVARLTATRFLAIEAGVALHILDVVEGGGARSIELVGSAESPGLGLSVAAFGPDHALIADWDHSTLVDLRNPAAPIRVGREKARDRVFEVVALSSGEYVLRGNTSVTRVTATLDRMSPEMVLNSDALQIEASAEFNGGSSALLIYNKGAMPLELRSLSSDPRISIALPGPSGIDGVDVLVPPDDVAFLELGVKTAEPFDTTFTFETNDPSAPNISVPIAVNPVRLKVGDPAPAFTLPGLDGAVYSLPTSLGKVVHLKLFNRY